MVLIPDIEGKKEDLFIQFLNEPGILDKLIGKLCVSDEFEHEAFFIIMKIDAKSYLL